MRNRLIFHNPFFYALQEVLVPAHEAVADNPLSVDQEVGGNAPDTVEPADCT